MLCQFTLSNYRSYRDETILTMQASSMKEFSQSLLPGGDGQSFLPVAAVYGPNAGGKSNLLEALGYVQSAVARPILSLKRGMGAREGAALRLPRCAPFAFDETHGVLPSEFEVYSLSETTSTAIRLRSIRRRSSERAWRVARSARPGRRRFSSARGRESNSVRRCSEQGSRPASIPPSRTYRTCI